ncbi:MAG: flagellar export protein FliJ [Veillonellales bacterium]
MQRFTFRLEALLNFRKMKKEQAQSQLAMATLQYHKEVKVLTKFEEELSQYQKLFCQRQCQKVTVELFKSFHNYIDKINKDILRQKDFVAAAEKNRQECLQIFEEAAKNCEAVEKLREKRFQQYQITVLQEEQKYLDEIGAQQYARKTGSGD